MSSWHTSLSPVGVPSPAEFPAATPMWQERADLPPPVSLRTLSPLLYVGPAVSWASPRRWGVVPGPGKLRLQVGAGSFPWCQEPREQPEVLLQRGKRLGNCFWRWARTTTSAASAAPSARPRGSAAACSALLNRSDAALRMLLEEWARPCLGQPCRYQVQLQEELTCPHFWQPCRHRVQLQEELRPLYLWQPCRHQGHFLDELRPHSFRQLCWWSGLQREMCLHWRQQPCRKRGQSLEETSLHLQRKLYYLQCQTVEEFCLCRLRKPRHRQDQLLEGLACQHLQLLVAVQLRERLSRPLLRQPSRHQGHPQEELTIPYCRQSCGCWSLALTVTLVATREAAPF